MGHDPYLYILNNTQYAGIICQIADGTALLYTCFSSGNMGGHEH